MMSYFALVSSNDSSVGGIFSVISSVSSLLQDSIATLIDANKVTATNLEKNFFAF